MSQHDTYGICSITREKPLRWLQATPAPTLMLMG